MAFRSCMAMGCVQMLSSPESAALVVEYARTTLAYVGWLLVATMTA